MKSASSKTSVLEIPLSELFNKDATKLDRSEIIGDIEDALAAEYDFEKVCMVGSSDHITFACLSASGGNHMTLQIAKGVHFSQLRLGGFKLSSRLKGYDLDKHYFICSIFGSECLYRASFVVGECSAKEIIEAAVRKAEENLCGLLEFFSEIAPPENEGSEKHSQEIFERALSAFNEMLAGDAEDCVKISFFRKNELQPMPAICTIKDLKAYFAQSNASGMSFDVDNPNDYAIKASLLLKTGATLKVHVDFNEMGNVEAGYSASVEMILPDISTTLQDYSIYALLKGNEFMLGQPKKLFSVEGSEGLSEAISNLQFVSVEAFAKDLGGIMMFCPAV